MFIFIFFYGGQFQWAVSSSGSPPLVNKYVCVWLVYSNYPYKSFSALTGAVMLHDPHCLHTCSLNIKEILYEVISAVWYSITVGLQ